MKHKAFFQTCMVIISIAFTAQVTSAQVTWEIGVVDSYDWYEFSNPAQFPGGQEALLAYIRTNLKYPVTAKANAIEGKVYIAFTVGTDGSIAESRVVRGIGFGCDEEVIRVVESMPAWTPARFNDIPVAVRMVLPVNFRVYDPMDQMAQLSAAMAVKEGAGM